MDSQRRIPNYRHYTVTSAYGVTGLTCTARVAEELATLAAPFLSLRSGRSPVGAWLLSVGATDLEAGRAERVEALGETPIDYLVDDANRRVAHIAPSGEEWEVQSLLRATRAIHRTMAWEAGALFLHSGLVEIHGLGVAFLGGSRSGKTTMIMANVLNGSPGIVCNDDMSVSTAGSEHAVATGWPRSISVRLDTLRLLFGEESAQDICASLRHPANRTLPSLIASGDEPHGTVLMQPDEYARYVGGTVRAASRIDVIVHLGFADEDSGRVLEEVAQERRPSLLDLHLLASPNKYFNVFGHGERASGSLPAYQALTSLPTYRYRYRFDRVLSEAAWLAKFLKANGGSLSAPKGRVPIEWSEKKNNAKGTTS